MVNCQALRSGWGGVLCAPGSLGGFLYPPPWALPEPHPVLCALAPVKRAGKPGLRIELEDIVWVGIEFQLLSLVGAGNAFSQQACI